MVKVKKIKDLTNEEALIICSKNGKKLCAKCPLYINAYLCFKYLNDKLNAEVKINV